MADGDAGRCEPYRVEWRHDLTARWMLMDTQEGLAAAEMTATRCLHACGGQVRVVEQRVVLVRGLGQDTGPDQAFMDWQQMQPPPFRAEMRHGEFLREHEQRMGRVEDAIGRLRDTSSEPEESEQAMPDGLFFSERELWEAARTWDAWARDRAHAVLARLAAIRRELRSGRSAAAIASAEGIPVVSDPDDRRDVEAAADADQPMDSSARRLAKIEATFCLAENSYGMLCDLVLGHDPPHHYTGDGDEPMDDQPLDQARTILNQLADTDTQRQAIRDATVTDTVGCAHRMSSGAVSLTACGECGAEPGDDCMAWRVLDASDEDMTEVERVLATTRRNEDVMEPGVTTTLHDGQPGRSPLSQLNTTIVLQDDANRDAAEGLARLLSDYGLTPRFVTIERPRLRRLRLAWRKHARR